MNSEVFFYSIKFFNYSYKKILMKINHGGYLVAPAASALVNIKSDKNYYKSLVNSKIAIFDSGLHVLMCKIFINKKIKKFSGYKLMQKILNQVNIKNKKILFVEPNYSDKKINSLYLNRKGFKNKIHYIAPNYKKNNILDLNLLKIIQKEKPEYIFMNIGGGVQEPLAMFISKKLDRFNSNCKIFCLGAALSYFSKKNTIINDFYDKYYLGWLARFFYNPKMLPRILSGMKLISFFISGINKDKTYA